MTNRRMFVGAMAITLLSESVDVRTQPTAKVFRVAMLYAAPPFSAAFLRRMDALGYQEGRNLQVEVITNDVTFGPPARARHGVGWTSS